MLMNKYSLIVCADDFDYKWCRKRGTWCHKDDYNFDCANCVR